jgi:hypothetical protein
MGPFNWAFNWMLQVPQGPGGPPLPPSSGTSTSTPSFSCTGVTYDQLLGALAALKTDILNVVATNSALYSVRNEILAAIANIPPPSVDCATSAELTAAKDEIIAAIGSPPDPNAGYAMVGGAKYTDLRQAALAVPDGGVVEIYGVMADLNGSAGFLNGCTIRGMTPDAKLEWTLGTAERMAFGKGLIVCAGAGKTYVVENLELCGARVTEKNGAGVRADQAASVTVQNCNLHDNENGILSIAGNLLIYDSTFKDNGNSLGNAHGVYATSGTLDLIAERNTFYTAIVGNQFKSRSKKTTFRQNTVAELDGVCSYQIDLSNGGDVLIEKNVIEQGPNGNKNWNIIAYGPEGLTADGRVNSLTVQNNIILNDYSNADGINIFAQPTSLLITGNTFVGPFQNYVVDGTLDATNNTHANRAAAGLAAYPALPGVPA